MPPEGAGELNETVQVVAFAPVRELAAHEKALMVGEMFDAEPFTLIEVVFEIVPSVAISVTVCEVVTADTVLAKLALVAPAPTVMEEGTVTTALLLARVTATPALGAAEVSVTVQVSVPAPIIEELAHFSPDSEAGDDPLPCSLTVLELLARVLLVAFTLSWALESVLDPGL
jgi:hypothetical protein